MGMKIPKSLQNSRLEFNPALAGCRPDESPALQIPKVREWIVAGSRCQSNQKLFSQQFGDGFPTLSFRTVYTGVAPTLATNMHAVCYGAKWLA